MSKSFVATCVFASFVASLSAADFPKQVKWNTAVKEGWFTDVGNWVNATVIPTNAGESATFEIGARDEDVTVKVPAGVTTNRAHFYVVHNEPNSSFTFDASNATFYQAPSTYLSNWQSFGFYIYSTQHIFNFEEVDTKGELPVCSFENGMIKQWKDNYNTNHIHFLSGTLDWRAPGGIATRSKLVISGTHDRTRVTVGEEAQWLGGLICQRGGIVHIQGGQHVLSGYNLGDSYAARSPNLEISSGSVEQTGTMQIGAFSSLREARFALSGDASYQQNANQYFVVGANTNSPSYATFCGTSVAKLGILKMGNQSGNYGGELKHATHATMALEDKAQVTLLNSAYVGYEPSLEPSRLTVKGEAVLNVNSGFYVPRNFDGSRGEVTIAETGRLRTDSDMYVMQNGSFVLNDGATHEQKHNLSVLGGKMELNDLAHYKMDISDNTINWLYIKDGGCVTFNGGTSFIDRIFLTSSTLSQTNILRVTGGVHIGSDENDTSTGYLPLTIGGDNANNLFEMEGGEMRLPRIVRVGYGNTGEGSAIFRMKGGYFEVFQEKSGHSGVLNVCDTATSKGRLELLGGRLRAQTVRGWTGSENKGGQGWSTFYANGGTVLPNYKTTDLLCTFDAAYLGEQGLAVDTDYSNVTVSQAFADETDKEGLFVKKGEGTLTVTRESTHACTRVTGGVLKLETSTYGRKLVVTGGAEVKLGESIQELRVAALEVGTAETPGYISLTSGKTITVTGENGFNPVNAVLVLPQIDQLGTYSGLFKIEGAFDTAKLANVKIKDAKNEYLYTLTADTLQDGSLSVKLDVTERPLTDATWLGRTADWQDTANWSPAAVPDLFNTVLLGETPVHKTLSLGANAKAHGVNVSGGDYTLSSESPFSFMGINLTGGRLTLDAPVNSATRLMVHAAAGTSLVMGKPLISQISSDSFEKSGSGSLDLLAASPDWLGNWTFVGGMTRIKAEKALGGYTSANPSSLTLGAGTLHFEGSAPHVVDRALEIAPESSYYAVVDTSVPVTFTKGMKVTRGAFVKTGHEAMNVLFPSGTFVVSVTNNAIASNGTPYGDFTTNANGDVSVAARQVAGLTVSEGVLSLQGESAQNTQLSQQHATLIGTMGPMKKSAELEISAMKYAQGDSGIHLFVGPMMSADNTATQCVLRLVNRAELNANTVRVGVLGHSGSCKTPYEHKLAVTNATLNASWSLIAGSGSDLNARGSFYVGAGGVVSVTHKTADSSCISINGQTGGLISEGGMLTHVSPISAGLKLSQYANGEITFADGGILKVPVISSEKHSDVRVPFTLRFDGGVFNVTGDNRASVIFNDGSRTVYIAEKGMTVNVEGTLHTFAIPVNGTGALKKTGAGELFMARAISTAMGATNVLADTYTANWEGTTRVENGMLTLEAGAATNTLDVYVAREAMLGIAGTQELGTLSGGGKIVSRALRSHPGENVYVSVDESAAAAQLSCTLDCRLTETRTLEDLPLFENIGLANVKVDFASADETPASFEKVQAVARLGQGMSADLSAWRGINAPPLMTVRFSVVENVVYATLRNEGLMLLFK